MSTLGNWARDLMTEHGETALQQETLGGYLISLEVYNPETRQVTLDTSKLTPPSIQRSALSIERNMIKQWMLEDVLQGGLLPPVAVSEAAEGRKILDGLQRTDVEAQALACLLSYERGDSSSIPGYAQRIMQKVGPKLLRAEEYLQQPVFLQVWRNLSEADEIRLFMVLNIGQQRIAAHQLEDSLEVLYPYLYHMFRKWNIPTTTAKRNWKGDDTARRRANRHIKWLQEHDVPLYMFEYIINGVLAYIDGNPHVTMNLKFEEFGQRQDPVNLVHRRLIDIGDEVACSDFTWVCNELNSEITRIYLENRKWRMAIMASDNFFLPLMAALGKAREQSISGQVEKIEKHKHELLELLREASPGSDPLQFYSPSGQCLESVQKEVRSNIGRTHRTIVYKAWLEYFRQGRATPTVALNWREASIREA